MLNNVSASHGVPKRVRDDKIKDMANIVKQVINPFEKIGEQIVKEAVKVPVDVASAAMESLGASAGTKQQQGGAKPKPQIQQQQESALQEMDQMKDPAARAAFAHEAIRRLAGHGPEQKKSLWQEKQEEEMAKKERRKQEDEASKKQLKPMSQKQKRGQMGKAKKLAQDQPTERSKNTQTG